MVTVKDLTTGERLKWTLDEVLHEINRDHSDEWVEYDETDWREGWDEFVEGNGYYSLKVNKYKLSRSYTVTEEVVMDGEDYNHAMSLCKSKDAWNFQQSEIEARTSDYQHHKIIGTEK